MQGIKNKRTAPVQFVRERFEFKLRLHKASVDSLDILNACVLGVAGTASIVVSINRHLVNVLLASNALERGYDSNVLSELTNSLLSKKKEIVKLNISALCTFQIYKPISMYIYCL